MTNDYHRDCILCNYDYTLSRTRGKALCGNALRKNNALLKKIQSALKFGQNQRTLKKKIESALNLRPSQPTLKFFSKYVKYVHVHQHILGSRLLTHFDKICINHKFWTWINETGQLLVHHLLDYRTKGYIPSFFLLKYIIFRYLE